VITDTSGTPVPFANIYVKALKTGTSSNIEGQYYMTLPKGKWGVTFQYLGYKSQELELEVSDQKIIKNVSLESRNYQIKEVKVLASGEDPAYYVMRKAIAMGEYYKNQVSQYDCEVYLKGSGRITKVPKLFKKELEKEGLKKDKTFVTENISKIHFRLPNEIEEEVLSVRSSGDSNDTNPMRMVTASLYDSHKSGMISPLNKNAFTVYKYRLESIFEDGGRMINRIKVIPRRKGKDLYSGYINIAENYWNLHSVDLKLKLPMTDVKMHQLFAPVDENTWMPVSFDFEIDFSAMGFSLKYLYVASISDYQIELNPKLEHSFIEIQKQNEISEAKELKSAQQQTTITRSVSKKEAKRKKEVENLLNKEDMSNADMHKLQRLMAKEAKESQVKTKTRKEELEIKIDGVKIAKGAKDKDSLYWTQVRPIPLSVAENISFVEKDSIMKVKNSPEYKDSIRQANRKFKPRHILFGKEYIYKEENTTLVTPGLLDFTKVSFNTVDGFKIRLPFEYQKKDTLGKQLNIKPELSYAFSRERVNYGLAANYRYNGLKRAWIGFEAGCQSFDFNQKQGINPLLNSASSLFFKNNYMKLFEKDFIQLKHRTDLANGFQLKTDVEYSKRKQLVNQTSFSFSNTNNRSYSNNIPDGIDPELVKDHNALIFSADIEYTPRHRYYIKKGAKQMSPYKQYPTFTLNYRQGLNSLLNSDSQFSYIGASIHQELGLGFNDYINYKVKAGSFLSKDKLYFTDYNHFKTNKPEVMLDADIKTFRLLDYYRYSNNSDFIEAHVKYTSDRLLLKRLPILNNSMLIQENIFINYLTQEDKKNYWELGYSLSQLFLIADLEYVSSFDGSKYRESSIKLKLNF